MKKLLFLSIVFSILFFSGCLNGNVSMKGRVTYSDDGEPLEIGTVSFVSETLHSRGEIGRNGQYVIGTMSKKDGLPPGAYKITVSGAYQDGGETAQGVPIEIPLIDPKYVSSNTSGLSIVVDRSTKEFNFSVDRYKGK